MFSAVGGFLTIASRTLPKARFTGITQTARSFVMRNGEDGGIGEVVEKWWKSGGEIGGGIVTPPGLSIWWVGGGGMYEWVEEPVPTKEQPLPEEPAFHRGANPHR